MNIEKLRSLIIPAFIFVAVTFALVTLAVTAKTTMQRMAKGNDYSECSDLAIGSTVSIHGGQFAMGSADHYPEEAPIINVSVGQFEMDTHEVTNAQFAQFVLETGYVTSAERTKELGFDTNGSAVFSSSSWNFVEGANWRHPEGPGSSIVGRENHPVVQVSLEDAKAYAKWAGRSLPTEAQWEYAARGGLNGKEFAWGDALTPGGSYMANNWQGVFPFVDSGNDGHKGRAPIGCYPPNGYELYDMIGNVWEWTIDPYFPNHRSTDTEFEGEELKSFDPRQPEIQVAVIKGGSFLCAPNFCRRYRPAARHAQDTNLGTNHIGFRTVASE